MQSTLTMSSKERERLKVLTRLAAGELSDEDGAQMLGISIRQFFRIKKCFLREGDAGVVHGLRGRASNRRSGPPKRLQVVELYRERYSDYGPTLFAEMLHEHHQIDLAPETLRRWLIAEGLWAARKLLHRHRRKRPRRGCVGELVQIDGSHHDWFEGRGPVCCLLVAIDDASSRVLMRFAPSENTRDVMLLMIDYVRRNGIPQAVYTDGGSVFYTGSDALTDFGSALEELGISAIHAHSPQAKGRVERSNRTQQDRLIKAMRQAGISSIDEANTFLEQAYLATHNKRFAATEELADVHRSSAGIDLERIFSYRKQRVVAKDFTVRLNKKFLQLLPSSTTVPRPGTRIELRQFLDGDLHIYHKREEIAYKTCEHRASPGKRVTTMQHQDHPWRQHGTFGNKKKNGCTLRQRTRIRHSPKTSQIQT